MTTGLIDLLRRSDLARRLAAGGAAGLGTRLGKGVLGLATAAVLARVLPPSSFGVFLLGQTVALFGSLVAVLGLENTLVREVAGLVARGTRTAVRTTFRRARGLALVGTLVVVTILIPGRGAVLRWLFDDPALASMAGWLGVWVALEAVNRIQVSALRGEHRLAVAATLDGFVRTAVFLGAVISLALLGPVSLETIFVAGAFSSGASAAAGWWVLARSGGDEAGAAEDGENTRDAPSIRTLWHRSWPLLGATALGFLGNQGDLWLVGVVAASDQAALYGSALKLIFVVSLPLFVLTRTLSSTMAEFHARGRLQELEVLLRATTTVVSAATGLMVLGLVLFADPVLTLLFGEFYAGATSVLVLLALAQVVFAGTGPCGMMLMMAGHERLKLAVTSVTATYLVLGSLWAGAHYGMLGVAAISASNKVLNNVLTLVLVRWKVGVWSHAYLSPVQARDGIVRLMRLTRSYAS